MSKPLTSPAKWQAKALASKLLMVSMPDLPANRLSQASVTEFPTGARQQSPVTTTRRLVMPANLSGRTESAARLAGFNEPRAERIQRCRSGLLILGGVVDGVLHRG